MKRGDYIEVAQDECSEFYGVRGGGLEGRWCVYRVDVRTEEKVNHGRKKKEREIKDQNNV